MSDAVTARCNLKHYVTVHIFNTFLFQCFPETYLIISWIFRDQNGCPGMSRDSKFEAYGLEDFPSDMGTLDSQCKTSSLIYQLVTK